MVCLQVDLSHALYVYLEPPTSLASIVSLFENIVSPFQSVFVIKRHLARVHVPDPDTEPLLASALTTVGLVAS